MPNLGNILQNSLFHHVKKIENFFFPKIRFLFLELIICRSCPRTIVLTFPKAKDTLNT
jgi:hypothetical protein